MSNWYCGDPCYVIHDERWGEFCNKLFAHPSYEKNNYPIGIEWEVDGKKYELEIWGSPGGDGVWRFSAGELGVDAGLLSIIPVECLDPQEAPFDRLGIMFEEKPVLDADYNEGKVWLNGELDNDWVMCDCGEMQRTEQIWDCEHCFSAECDNCYPCCDGNGEEE